MRNCNLYFTIRYLCSVKVYSAAQIKEIDAYTIEHEPISSVNLMERASIAVAHEIMERWGNAVSYKVFAGPGNNGGDALAVSRIMAKAGCRVSVYLFNTKGSLSPDCQTNKIRLHECRNVNFVEVTSSFAPPVLGADDVVIDGLFGTGVSRPLSGGFASMVKYINASEATVVSIDVPSGLMCEDNENNVADHIIKADYTFTFQYPKLSFLFPENEQYVGQWKVLDIKLMEPDTEDFQSPYNYTETSDIVPMLRTRMRFAHKGTAGNAILVAGKKGMAGAAILASRACLRSGVGKITVRTQEGNVLPLQIAVPEAVLSIEGDEAYFSHSFPMQGFDAIAIGPGIGKEAATAQAMIEQIKLSCNVPIILDADAINILGDHRGWISQLSKDCIFTPHKKELFGLIGTSTNSYDQLCKTRELCSRQQIYIVIKGAFSAVVCPDGSVCFNPTGNQGMATAGSGDVLTGVILALLAQGYDADSAVKLGVYLHGLAGDVASETRGYEGLIASDIVESLPEAFLRLRKDKKK